MSYTKNHINCDDLIFSIETDVVGMRNVHILAYGYCAHDEEPDCRFIEYTGFYVSLDEVLTQGIFKVEENKAEYIKQYIIDCTYNEMLEYYQHYDSGLCPKPITQITSDLPDGVYVIKHQSKKRGE